MARDGSLDYQCVTEPAVASEGFFFGERILELPDVDCDGAGDFTVGVREWSEHRGAVVTLATFGVCEP